MGRESSTNLEQAALSFLSAIDPERGIDAVLEALGGSASESVAVEGGDHQMVATKIGSKAFLVVIARKSVARSAVRKTVRELVTQLSKIASEMGSPLEGTTAHPRVKVRPPR